MSVLIALVALIILILSISYIIIAQPAKDAGVKNIIDPFNQYQNSNSGNTPNFISYTDVDDDDEDSDEDPEISISDITINHGQVYTMDLDSYSSDEEDSHSDLDFDITYTPTFTPAPITLNFDSSNHVLTITEVNGSWTGSQVITIEVTDTDDNSDIDSFNVIITDGSNPPIPGSPVISGLPDVAFGEEGTDNTIDLDNYVSDSNNIDSELTWTFTGNTNINVIIDSTSHIVSFTSPIVDWTGAEFITFRVEDPDGNYDEDVMLVTVTNVDDPAVWNPLTSQSINEDSAIGTLVYANILGECSDVDSPILFTVVSTHPGFTLGLSGNNLVINTIQPNWWGTETVVVSCNGVLTTFSFTITRLLDDCIIISTDEVDYLYCD